MSSELGTENQEPVLEGMWAGPVQWLRSAEGEDAARMAARWVQHLSQARPKTGTPGRVVRPPLAITHVPPELSLGPAGFLCVLSSRHLAAFGVVPCVLPAGTGD